eukprot:6710023-Prymnesium_polylepis.1
MQIAHCLGQHDPGGFGLGGKHLGQPSRAGRHPDGIVQRRRDRVRADMPARSAGNRCGLASATSMKASGTSINESD